MIQLKWHGEIPSNALDIEKIILEDMVINLSDINKPSDLIFHTIFLDDGPSYMTGPSVLIWGEEGDDQYYHCEYHLTTELVTFDENEENFDKPKKVLYK